MNKFELKLTRILTVFFLTLLMSVASCDDTKVTDDRSKENASEDVSAESSYEDESDEESDDTVHTGMGIIEETNFFALKEELAQGQKVLIVEFHAEDCPYCRLLEDNFLKPMLKDKNYTDKVMIRKVDVHVGQTLIDFDGREVPHSEFIGRYRAGLTPTMVFLDKDGFQVAERMVGINTIDFFGAYLDQEIEKGLAAIRKESSAE